MRDSMYRLKDMLIDELDEIVEKGQLTMDDLCVVHTLTDTIKNIHKIANFEGDGSSRYSETRGRSKYSMSEGKSRLGDKLHKMLDEEDLTSEERRTIQRALGTL